MSKNIARLKASNAITFAQMQAKYYYDRRYYSQFFRKGDYALLRLYREYNISITAIIERKYDLQFINLFRVLKRVERLTYRLDILVA